MPSPRPPASNPSQSASASRAKGNEAEEAVARWLEARGYHIVERNFTAKKLGELDIVAYKEGVWHFVEVKSGRSFEPLQNMTPAKIGRLLRSIELYLKAKKITEAYCLDVAAVREGEIDYLSNVTM